MMEISEELMKRGECSATFLVRVHKRTNEPWYGNIIWVSERCERSFSTMQELFELMNDTLAGETAGGPAGAE